MDRKRAVERNDSILAAKSKYLAEKNKSSGVGKATKKRVCRLLPFWSG
jgi:hypothetical protein